MPTAVLPINIPCATCGETLKLPAMPIDDPRPENARGHWDQVGSLLPLHNWTVARDQDGNRHALCPACAKQRIVKPKDLPPFNAAAACPKCGGRDVDKRHDSGREASSLTRVDHLARECGGCGYQWAEACLDATPKPKPEPWWASPWWAWRST